MSGQTHTSEAQCPSCGNSEAIVRVRGNAFSAVCTACRRADVTPLLNDDDLREIEGETLTAELFELDAVRYGDPSPLQLLDAEARVSQARRELDLLPLAVELRMPVPPR